jgi:hypothetical protein
MGCPLFVVIPARGGIQRSFEELDSRLRGNDGREGLGNGV